MKIDLKWFLPFVIPFAFLGWARAFWWMVGANWNADFAAFICVFAGLWGGGFALGYMHIEGIRWTITIGRKGRDE